MRSRINKVNTLTFLKKSLLPMHLGKLPVLSEFCNAWLRIEFNNWKKKAQNNAAADYKKDFVNSTAYS